MADFSAPPVVVCKADGNPVKGYRPSRHAGGMKQAWIRTAVLSSVLCLGGITVQPEAIAQQGVVTYDIRIRESSLADALLELARQTTCNCSFRTTWPRRYG
jgi:hypothetical protein